MLKSHSKGPESASSGRIGEVYDWASQLASESREPHWISDAYLMPSEVSHLLTHLRSVRGALVGLVGYQGVGKSSALLALATSLRRTKVPDQTSPEWSDTMLFKWRRGMDLYKTLMDYDHEAALEFRSKYGAKMRSLSSIKRTLSYGGAESGSNLQRVQALLQDLEKSYPWVVQVDDEEKQLGKTRVESTREDVWRGMLSEKHSIFIDMPDYSKTDRRMMAKDLEEIYWLWQSLNRKHGVADSTPVPNIVIAIQKEMFGGHFFLDKMQKIELQPLQPEMMVEAYERRFKNTDPFTEDTLLTLARMSRGIFRRFLRYIMLTLDLWERKAVGGCIGGEVVTEAVTMERLAADMELELADLFPKHSDLSLLAVRLLMLLEESGERKQSELADFLEVKPYELSRLLTKLEATHYISRRRDGNDKIVSLFTAQDRPTKP